MFRLLTSTLLLAASTSTLVLGMPHSANVLARSSAAETNSTIRYYAANPSCSANLVYTGTIAPEKCQDITVTSVSLQSRPDQDCGFVLFKGSTDCNVTMAAGSATWIQLPKGNGSTCVDTEVYDSEWTHASGLLTCY